MNSKELLEQATAKIEKMNDLMASIDVIEVTLSAATKPDAMIAFFEPSLGVIGGAIGIRYILADNVMEDIKNTVLKEIQKVRDEKAAELEQLLRIQPIPAIPTLAQDVSIKCDPYGHVTILPPDPRAATKDMFQPVKKQPDPVEEKFEVHSITAEDKQEPVDKSLEMYPAKKRGRQADYPEGMTRDVVKKMYIDDGMTINAISKHFCVPYAKASNFITKHKLARSHNDKSDKQPDKQPEETERP